jgi:glycosyltransferase involved in cell wall biosynthesis
VSVVLPTRDRAGFLPDALGTALAQIRVDVEVVVVDDASTDTTPDVLGRLSDTRVRVVRNERSLGLAGARNAGIRVAEGAWIAFLDDDDLWAPEKLERQVAAAEEAGASWAYAGAFVLTAHGAVVHPWPLPEPAAVLRELLRLNVIPAGSSNVLVRADALRELGGFDEDFSRLADWDLWIRLAADGPPAAVRDRLVAYRHHAANMSVDGQRAALSEFDRLRRKHRALGSRLGVEFDRMLVEEWLAKERSRGLRVRAEEALSAGRRTRAAAAYVRAGLALRSKADLRRAAAIALGRASVADPPAPGPEWLRPRRV